MNRRKQTKIKGKKQRELGGAQAGPRGANERSQPPGPPETRAQGARGGPPEARPSGGPETPHELHRAVLRGNDWGRGSSAR